MSSSAREMTRSKVPAYAGGKLIDLDCALALGLRAISAAGYSIIYATAMRQITLWTQDDISKTFHVLYSQTPR